MGIFYAFFRIIIFSPTGFSHFIVQFCDHFPPSLSPNKLPIIGFVNSLCNDWLTSTNQHTVGGINM